MFKAEEHLAQRLFYMFFYKENAMEMVWHHLKGQNIYLRIANRYIMPITLYLLAKFCQFHTRSSGVPFWPSLLPTTFPNNGKRPSVAIVIM